MNGYRERSFKFEWGFTCGWCGMAVYLKEDDIYYQINDHEEIDIPLKYACSLSCVKSLYNRVLEWNREKEGFT